MPISNRGRYSPEANGKLSDLVELGKWKQGIINRLDPKDVPNDALLDALNVDFRIDGSVRTREGYQMVENGKCHSVFTFKNNMYFVMNKNFVKMDKNENITVLIQNYTSTKVYYVEVADELYFSTENKTNKINKAGTLEYWGIKSPQEQCSVTVGEQGSGSMKKGKYMINYSYLYGSYETAVHPLSVTIDVPYDNFNLELECFPSSQSTSANFYITPVNGEELFLAKTGYSVTVDEYDRISSFPKQHLDAIIPLENLCFSNGRIWGTKDVNIFFSADRDYRQYNPVMYIGIDNTNIVLFKAVDNGCYVVTEKATYFLQVKNPESIADGQLVKIFDHSAIKGTLFEDNKAKKVGWLSTEGYIIGDHNGQLQNITDGKVDFSKNYKEGCSIRVKKNGIDKIIFSLKQDGEKTDFQTIDINDEV